MEIDEFDQDTQIPHNFRQPYGCLVFCLCVLLQYSKWEDALMGRDETDWAVARIRQAFPGPTQRVEFRNTVDALLMGAHCIFRRNNARGLFRVG
jgi:hypothetical protein